MREDELIVPFTEDFAALVRQQGERVAIVHGEGDEVSYRALWEQAGQMAAWLSSEFRVGMGSRVIAVLPNSFDAGLAMMACFRLGAEYAPLPCQATVNEVERLVKTLDPAVILLNTALSGGFIEAVGATAPTHVIDLHGARAYTRAGGTAELATPERAGRLLIATSGSTGAPKAIVIDADRLWSAGRAYAGLYGLEALAPRFWNYLPMSYLGGLFNLFLIPLAARGSCYIGEAFSGRTILNFWNTVNRFDIDALWLVPTVLRGLLELAPRIKREQGPSSIKTCFLGTAPVSLDEKTRFEKSFGIVPLESYGLTETTFITSEQRDGLFNRSAGSVGRVLPYVDVKLVPAEAGDEASPREIAVKSPFMMLGYVGSDGAIDLPLDQQGYFRTGDLAEERNGSLAIVGRSRDIIKKGGLLVQLREVELLAESSGMVGEAVAVATPHSFYGESYNLFVTRGGAELDAGALLRWLEERLVKHKLPDRVLVTEELPKTASGKVQKHLLLAGA